MQSTIALVDDDRNILTSVSIALEAEGFKVRTYTNGSEALRGMTSNPVDLAILDIKMPRPIVFPCCLPRVSARMKLPY